MMGKLTPERSATRLCAFELKATTTDADSTTGRFEGLLSPYGAVDLQGDRVMPGAFTRTIAARGGEVPLLWQHSTDEPIGLLRLRDTDGGLMVDGEVDLEIPEGKRAFSAVRRRYCKGLSIGYSTIADRMVNGVRELIEVELFEGSIVTFPAAPSAQITSVKRDGEIAARFVEQLRVMTRAIRVEVLGAKLARASRVLDERVGERPSGARRYLGPEIVLKPSADAWKRLHAQAHERDRRLARAVRQRYW